MTTQQWNDAMLDRLADTVAQNAASIQELNQKTARLEQLFEESKQRDDEFRAEIRQQNATVRAQWEESKARSDRLSEEFKEQGIRFQAYQQGIQWVVQLAFTLIASATLTVIVTAVLRR